MAGSKLAEMAGREETLETRNADVCVKLEGEWETWRGDVGYFFPSRRVFPFFFFLCEYKILKPRSNPISISQPRVIYYYFFFFFETITVYIYTVNYDYGKKEKLHTSKGCNRTRSASNEARSPAKILRNAEAHEEFFYDINYIAPFLNSNFFFFFKNFTRKRERSIIDVSLWALTEIEKRIDRRYAVQFPFSDFLVAIQGILLQATSLLEKTYRSLLTRSDLE